jgi:hypothetical protein
MLLHVTEIVSPREIRSLRFEGNPNFLWYHEPMKVEWNKVTWYSKLAALVIFIALPFLGFWFGVRYGAERQYMADIFSGFKNAASQGIDPYYADVAAWQTDQNHGGWSVAYPIDFETTDNYSAMPTTGWRMGDANPGLQFFSLIIPRVFEPQTNFSDAKLTVGSSRDAGALAACLTPDPSGPLPEPTMTATINGTDFTVFHSTDAGAGNYYETTSYRTVRAGQCWAVEYTIHSSHIGNYPPEYRLKPLDETKLRDVLDRIVGTFRFL